MRADGLPSLAGEGNPPHDVRERSSTLIFRDRNYFPAAHLPGCAEKANRTRNISGDRGCRRII